jgi:hypothetical protein
MAAMTMLAYGQSNLLRDAPRNGLSACFQGLSVCCAAYLVLLTTVSITNGLSRQGNSTSGTGTVQTVSSSAKRLTLAVSLPGISSSDVLLQQSRPDLSLAAAGAGQLEVGKPDLPAFGQWVLVPNGATLSLRIGAAQPVIYDDIDVLPVQPPRPDSPGAADPQFTVDVVTYSTDADYPGVFAYAEPVRTVRSFGFTHINIIL